MAQLPNPSKPTLYIGLIALLLFAVVLFGYFIYTFVELASDLISLPPSISFDKGSFYLPGVVLGLSVLIFAIVHESVLRKELTKRLSRICTRTGISAAFLMLVLPQFVEYGIEAILIQHHYSICEGASHQWLHAKTIVYTTDQYVCEKLVDDK